MVKNPPANTGDMGSILGSEASPGEGNGNPFQYACLGNPVDRGAWQAIVQRVANSWKQSETKLLSIHTECSTLKEKGNTILKEI